MKTIFQGRTVEISPYGDAIHFSIFNLQAEAHEGSIEIHRDLNPEASWESFFEGYEGHEEIIKLCQTLAQAVFHTL